MSRYSNKKNSANGPNRGSTGSDIARSTLKVFLSNGDSRSVKCGEATDIKVLVFSYLNNFCQNLSVLCKKLLELLHHLLVA